MGELDTYRLADFIPFGPRAYDRLFVGHNADLWPAPLIAALVGAVALWAAWRGRGRLVGGLLAAAWVWIGWAWYAESYAALNWAGARMAWVAYGQAAVLGGMAAFGGLGRERRGGDRWLGLGLAVAGFALYPLLDVLAGRAWAGVEVFGHAPEPTALVTLGLVLALGRWRVIGLLLPTLVCLEGAATAWVLETPGWWVPTALAAVAWLGLLWSVLRRR